MELEPGFERVISIVQLAIGWQVTLNFGAKEIIQIAQSCERAVPDAVLKRVAGIVVSDSESHGHVMMACAEAQGVER